MSGIDTKSGLTEITAVGKAIWWMILLRGLFAVAFGVLAILFPDPALVALAWLFAIYSLLDGVTTIAHAIRIRPRSPRWGWLLAQGILSVLAGIVAALFPVLAGVFGALILIYLIAFWSVFTGVAGFRAAHAAADGARKTWGYVTAALSVLFGVALVVIATLTPASAVAALIIVIGVYAIVTGLLLVAFAFAARSAAKRMLAA